MLVQVLQTMWLDLVCEMELRLKYVEMLAKWGLQCQKLTRLTEIL
jgi:hypothetical protein